MEKILGHSPAEKNQDKNLTVNSELYDAAIASSINNEVSELSNEEKSKKNLIVEGPQLSGNCESPVFFKESTEKVSPTLLESAFKVMKTLFSPEKAKNKTTNSVNQHKSVLESSNTSFHLRNKQKMITTEPEIEIHVMKSPLPEENDLKDKKQLTVPVLSPLTFDLQSNDDDSFLTTVSYDESFQSAVTHFDENGEVTKICDNLPNSVFNNSQDLDFIESCNSSMENSECCLENTMLKNESSSSKEINHNGFSFKNTNGNNDQNKEFDHKNNEGTNANCSYQASGVQIEVLKATDSDNFTQASNTLITKISDLDDEFSAVNGFSNEVDFHESEINSEGIVLKKENQTLDKITEPEFQHLVSIPQSVHSSSSDAEGVKTVQENKVICSENLNWDFVEMENTETDDKITITAEKSVLQSRLESPTPHLSKSDLNEVDEMLMALKNDSETITSMNSFNRNYVVYTGTGNFCYLKSPEFIHTNQKSPKSKGSTKPERPMSSGNSRSDKSKGLSHHRILEKTVDKSTAFKEVESPLVFSSNKETEKQIESQKEYQNQLKLNNTSNFNISYKKVSANSSEELNFEINATDPASMPPKVSTVLYPNERPIVSPHLVPVSNSSNVSPLTSTNTEVVENDDGSETTSLLVGEAENGFSLKHSTPVSVLHNNSSFCSSNQNLSVNSLEINERIDGKTSEFHNASSDFLSKAMGIFFEPSNLSLSTERICSDGLTASPKPFKESNGSILTSEFNRLQRTRTQILKEKESPTSRKVNLVAEVDSSNCQKEGFEKKMELPEFDQPTDKKLDLNKTVEAWEPAKLDKIKSLEVSNMGNKVNSKMLNNEEHNSVDKSSNKKIDTKSEISKPLPFNEVNDTYDKESDAGNYSGCDFNDLNKIREKSFTLGFVSEKERSEFSEYQETENFLSPIKEPSQPMSHTFSIPANESLTGNTDVNKNTDSVYVNNVDKSLLLGSFTLSPSSGNSLQNQIPASSNHITENFSGNLKEPHEASKVVGQLQDGRRLSSGESNTENHETAFPSELAKNIEPEVAKLIEQQFTPTDIAKICDIAILSESLNNGSVRTIEDETETKVKNVLSPKSFDFLNSIQGKPTGRDLSRESLYVKFDPLVQPPTANSLIDFTKEVEVLAAPESSPVHHSSSICEELLAISPEKKSHAIVPPLTPLSDRNKKSAAERQKDLQNEIYFLKNLYSERERINKAKMEAYESQIAKLTGDKCVLEDKLKEYAEREISIVKKMTAQTRDIEQLKFVMKEYVKVISVLTTELETTRKENIKEIETLTAEKESYMNHLLNTEAAFSDVHTKYEKSKKTIESLKMNEILYRNTIAEHSEKMEEYKKKSKEAQEKAVNEFENIMAELHDSKNMHTQEVSRLRAQLKKTELKLEALQESLDQKIKENQQLTAICDELIEGKK